MFSALNCCGGNDVLQHLFQKDFIFGTNVGGNDNARFPFSFSFFLFLFQQGREGKGNF